MLRKSQSIHLAGGIFCASLALGLFGCLQDSNKEKPLTNTDGTTVPTFQIASKEKARELNQMLKDAIAKRQKQPSQLTRAAAPLQKSGLGLLTSSCVLDFNKVTGQFQSPTTYYSEACSSPDQSIVHPNNGFPFRLDPEVGTWCDYHGGTGVSKSGIPSFDCSSADPAWVPKYLTPSAGDWVDIEMYGPVNSGSPYISTGYKAFYLNGITFRASFGTLYGPIYPPAGSADFWCLQLDGTWVGGTYAAGTTLGKYPGGGFPLFWGPFSTVIFATSNGSIRNPAVDNVYMEPTDILVSL